MAKFRTSSAGASWEVVQSYDFTTFSNATYTSADEGSTFINNGNTVFIKNLADPSTEVSFVNGSGIRLSAGTGFARILFGDQDYDLTRTSQNYLNGTMWQIRGTVTGLSSTVGKTGICFFSKDGLGGVIGENDRGSIRVRTFRPNTGADDSSGSFSTANIRNIGVLLGPGNQAMMRHRVEGDSEPTGPDWSLLPRLTGAASEASPLIAFDPDMRPGVILQLSSASERYVTSLELLKVTLA